MKYIVIKNKWLVHFQLQIEHKLILSLGEVIYLNSDDEFIKLMTKAKELNMKIVLDCLTRVSSSRPNRIYKDKFVYSLDFEGKL